MTEEKSLILSQSVVDIPLPLISLGGGGEGEERKQTPRTLEEQRNNKITVLRVGTELQGPG